MSRTRQSRSSIASKNTHHNSSFSIHLRKCKVPSKPNQINLSITSSFSKILITTRSPKVAVQPNQVTTAQNRLTQNSLRTNLPTRQYKYNRDRKKKRQETVTAPADTTDEWRDADVEATAAEAGTRVTATAASIATSCAIGYRTPNELPSYRASKRPDAVIPPLLCLWCAQWKCMAKEAEGEMGAGGEREFGVALGF